MIDYQTYCRIHALHADENLSINQIADCLSISPTTVSRWLNKSYKPRSTAPRSSLLDPYKGMITRWLLQHDYSATQIFNKIRQAGYEGGYSILTEFIRMTRPPQKPAFLTLSFAPGECAQVDWGSAGTIQVGSTRRRVSFFVMVLCYSRMIYIEFTLSEAQDQFLSCHQHAFEYFRGVPRRIMVDNLKCAVQDHPIGTKPVYNPRYLDFCNHFGTEPYACNVRAPQEKGRVENGVGYVKKNFLRGMELTSFDALNPAAKEWLDTVANIREHRSTHKRPIDLFKQEHSELLALSSIPYDVGVNETINSTSQFRINFETNRYSVPSEYASRRLTLRIYPTELVIYHEQKLIAKHVRSYDRHQDILIAEHQRKLLQQKRKARDQQHLMHLLRLSPHADEYYRQLDHRRLNPVVHVRKIIALTEIYGDEATGRAIEDALEYQAYSSDYIANILEQRSRNLPEPSALHLTRREDLLELEIPPPDLTIYDTEAPAKDPHNDEDDKENPS